MTLHAPVAALMGLLVKAILATPPYTAVTVCEPLLVDVMHST